MSKWHTELPDELYSGQWIPHDKGMSGSYLYRGRFNGEASFLKCTPHTHRMPVKAEYERLKWLMQAESVPVVRFAKYLEDDAYQYMVTEAVDGVDLFEYEAEPDVLIRKYAEAIRMFHDLPISDCPFITTIDDQIAFARRTLENQEVNESLLDTEFQGRDLNEMLDEMIAIRPDKPDNVVVHGDPYNDNLVVNPQTGKIQAWIDVGMMGVADRYTDLAMIYDDIIQTFGESAWHKFLEYYGLETIDDQRMRFYRLFNEFI